MLHASAILKKWEESVKSFFTPGVLFEELGYQYIGPVDGHDLNLLIDLFSAIKQMSGPVFVHLRTVKGKGYDPAEGDARKWHAVTPPMFKDTAAGTASGSIDRLSIVRATHHWVGEQLNPFEHCTKAAQPAPKNLNPFWVWARPEALRWVEAGGEVWPWNA